jgi:hypothetical protein
VNKDWDYTKETMDAYCTEVHKLEKHFQGLEILHVMRDLNIAADVLAKLGSDRAKVPPMCLFKNSKSLESNRKTLLLPVLWLLMFRFWWST